MNQKLVESVRKTTSGKENVASVLTNILCIGKEAIYRRLRGEVPFTFDEVAKISQELDFSIDNIVGIRNKERAVFDISVLETTDYVERYTERLEGYVKQLRKMSKAPSSKVSCAINSLPFSFYLQYENLSKFRLFKWLYQEKRVGAPSYKDIEVGKEMLSAQKKFVAESRLIEHSSFILAQDIFVSFTRDVNYFHKLNLIDDEDLLVIKRELIELLDEIESLTITGTYNSGKEIFIYLCNLDLDASYFLYEYEGYEYAHLRLYSINGIDSQNPKVCQKHREWIESLKRYSTLITQSGEMQRHDFFRKQRSLINGIGSGIPQYAV